MNVVGFDTKPIRRLGAEEGKSFISPIGIGIETENEIEFRKSYDDAMEQTFSDFQKERRRKVYKSYDISRIFGTQNFLTVAENTIELMLDNISSFYIFTTIIPISQYPVIHMFDLESGHERRKAIPCKDYLNGLNNGYPFICTWRFDEEGYQADKYLLDNFTYHETKAWDMVSILNPKILYKGDTCNPILAIADLVANYVDERLYGQYISLETISNLFDSNKWRSSMLPIGARYLHTIKPRLKRTIDVNPYICHPVHFLVPEERPEFLDSKHHIKTLEGSRFADYIINTIWGTDGCWKIFAKAVDYKWFDSGKDILYYFGSTGKKQAEHFQLINGIEISDIHSI